MLNGIVTMASVTTTSCRQGAKAPWAPASSERRSAIGAPGEIAITMDAGSHGDRQVHVGHHEEGEQRHEHQHRQRAAQRGRGLRQK